MRSTKTVPTQTNPPLLPMNCMLQAAALTMDIWKPTSKARWQHFIDNVLINWLRDPSQLEDEDCDAPSGTIIRLSIDYAEKWRDDGMPAPTSVVPDPNGGIVFELRNGSGAEVFHFWDDATIEYMRFDGSRLAERALVAGMPF